MFILPFLKYFKPFRWRLIVAIIGMVIVGVLSATPILIGKEALHVLLLSGKTTGNDLKEQLGGLASGFIPKTEEPAALDAKPVATAKDDAKASDGKSKSTRKLSPSKRLKAWLEDKMGPSWTVPYNWYETHIQTLHQWYENQIRESPHWALATLAIIMSILVLVKGVAEFMSKYELAYTFFLTNLQIREDIFNTILKQDYLFFNHHSPGYLHSRINSDVKAVRSVLEGLLSDGVQQPITILVMFVLLLYFNAWLTLGVFIIMPIVGGLLYYFARVIRKNMRKQKSKEDQLSGGMTESLNNIRLVKAFGTEKIEMAKFHQRTMELFRFIIARRIAKFGASPLMEWIGTVAFSGVLLIGGWMIFLPEGHPFQMTIIDFVAFLWTLSRFYKPLKSLAAVNTKYQEAQVSGVRMIEMLNLKPQLLEAPDPVPFTELKHEIVFQNVGFSYHNKRVLEDINLRVAVGQRIAFVGPSGGGKTTLVNMLARLFDPAEGQILIDGADLRQIRIKDWRTNLAIVTQDTFLFDDSIADNIAYGMCEYTERGMGQADLVRVEAAARAANAHDFIMQLDGGKGYQTRIGPTGGRLSGGQRQRLAIARAIYRDPKILILDEATSALDAQSQAIVQEALNRLMVGRTTFVIAHRISTVSGVDCIYVIEKGRITEFGSHDELLAQQGFYYKMVTKTGLVDAPIAGEGSIDSLIEDDLSEEPSLVALTDLPVQF